MPTNEIPDLHFSEGPSASIEPASDLRPVGTAENATQKGKLIRGVWVGTAGTVGTMVTRAGSSLSDVPLVAGFNPISVQSITIGAGTATGVYYVY